MDIAFTVKLKVGSVHYCQISLHMSGGRLLGVRIFSGAPNCHHSEQNCEPLHLHVTLFAIGAAFALPRFTAFLDQKPDDRE